jgi:hypothetical protein
MTKAFKVGIVAPTYSGISNTANSTGFSLAGGTTSKTLTISNTITLAASADSQTFTFPSTSDTLAGLATTQTFTATNTFTPSSSTSVPLIVQGYSSQSADAFQAKDSSGNIKAGIGINGNAYINNSAPYQGTYTQALTSAAYISATQAQFTYNYTSQLYRVGQRVTVAGVTGGNYNQTGTVYFIGGSSGAFIVGLIGSGYTNVAGTGGTATQGAALSVGTGTRSNVGIVVQAQLAQAANLQEWQIYTGAVGSAIDANGNLISGGFAGTPSLYADITSGTISLGAGLTTGTLNLAVNASTSATTINIGHSGATTTIAGQSYYASGGTNYLQVTTPSSSVSQIQTPAISTASTMSNALVLQTGNSTGTSATSGYIQIDTGTGPSGTGTIQIGQSNSNSVLIGRANSSAVVSLAGSLNVNYGSATMMNLYTNGGTGSPSITSSGISIYTGSVSGSPAVSGSISIEPGSASTTAGTVTIGTLNASALTIGRSGVTTTINGTLALGTALAATSGGTGQSTYATGDILYASATNTLSKLSAGTNGYVLTLASGVPTWAAASGGSSITTATVNTNTAQTIDTVAISSFTTIEYTISIKQGSVIRSSKLLVNTDASATVNDTEYGIIETGGTLAGIVVGAVLSSTNSLLQVTITNAATTNATVKFTKTVL